MTVPAFRRLGRPAAVIAAVAALAAPVVAAAPAEAASVPNGAIVTSACSSQTSKYAWNGLAKAGLGYPRGTVYVCWWKYKMTDADSRADYYAVVASSYWTHSAGPAGYDAAMSQSIQSSVAARDNVYNATGSFQTNTNCSSPVSLSIGWGPFSASTSPTICSGYKVTRSTYNSAGAGWSSPKAAGLRKIETMFTQKVPQGTVPRYTVRFSIPIYTNTYIPTSPYISTTVRHNTVSFYG